MDVRDFFSKSVKQANGCIKEIHTGDLENATPCSEWNLRQLLNHIVYEVLWVPELVAGKSIAEVGDRLDGDVLGDDPIAAWHTATREALQVLENTDLDMVIHLSSGESTAADYIAEVGIDVLIHGWDVAQAIQCNQIFEPDVAAFAYEHIQKTVESSRKAGYFGAAIEVSNDVSIQTKLLALTGRKAQQAEA